MLPEGCLVGGFMRNVRRDLNNTNGVVKGKKRYICILSGNPLY